MVSSCAWLCQSRGARGGCAVALFLAATAACGGTSKSSGATSDAGSAGKVMPAQVGGSSTGGDTGDPTAAQGGAASGAGGGGAASGRAGASGNPGTSGAAGAGAGAAGTTSEAGAAGESGLVDLTECGAPTPCDPAVSKVGELIEKPSWFALHCIIQAFSARTPGVYLQQTTIVGLDGEGTTTVAYLIKADGTVNRITKSGDTLSSPQICAVRPQTYYAPCLDVSGSDSPLACQDTAWVTDCQAGSVSCE